ncbi:DUF4825 domain-containing protein [Desulfosporosinus fructosivorans]|uniref:DUF4825 domain-containing protein n=1 Tax=Desulfosporosinus fructosivorans TaxID=2018669 RepID=A0A4Z0QVX8_9FIRM|nr:M56 family metallopeptidase [Desulfosporosinus fructosivorans]TGE34962.1 DUF4825 domain-containing protein [Desulfosporosinus fructosivorans]
MLNNIFLISLTMSAVIVLLLIISPFLLKRYSAKWCYFVWLLLALRLIIPWRLELPQAPVHLPAPSNQTIILNQDGMPGLIMGDSYLEKGNNPSAPVSASTSASAFVSESASADYTSVITLQELLLVIWALGAMSFFLFHMISYVIFQRKIKPYCSETDRTVLDSVLNSMKIKGRPQLFRCSKIASPMLTGFFQAAILLPDLDYTREELSVVLQHELIHYKRGDIWYKLFLLTANSVHWFNPFVYFMIKAANRDLEYSCDDIVVRNSDLNFRKEYSLTILKSMQNSRTTHSMALSTGFSESGKSAKKRFANIFDRNNKKRGIWALVFVLALAGVTGTMVACSSGQVSVDTQESSDNQKKGTLGQPDGYAEKLYQYQGTYTGDNSTVAAIIHALSFTDLPLKSIELQTDSEPYGITVNYQVDSRANYRSLGDIETSWNKNAAVMFSLIPNAGETSFRLYDQYGDFAGSYYNRENLSERYGMEYFTDDTVKEAAGSLDSFTNYLNNVSTIKNAEDFYSEGQKQSIEREKQIYSVIGDDRQITVNSGTGFPVTVTDAFAADPPIKELAAQKEILAQYTGKKIKFLTYQINNFKTNDVTFYLFAFDGEKMIAYADLKTAASEQNVIRILNALQ